MSPPVPAGEFGAWLRGFAATQHRDGAAEVPCGECRACCTSSQFIHVESDESRPLGHIPGGLLVPAPGAHGSAFVLGFDERGRCPMSADGDCTLYRDRPRTCRHYDCRVFAAAGVTPRAPDIATRAAAWSFTYADAAARSAHEAVGRAARFLRDHADAFSRPGPEDPVAIALIAVASHQVFLEDVGSPRSSERIAAEVVAAFERFDESRR